MRRMPLLLLTVVLAAPLAAQEEGERIEDKKSGLVVQMPDGWSRESSREKGAVKFAGLYDLTPSKYVLFTVETGPATGFDEAAWLANEKTAATKHLKSMDTPWTTEPIMVGGARAVRYTVGGKANAEKEFDLRIRGCGIVRNDVFFRIAEHSYSRAHVEAADALKTIWEAVKFEEANPFAEDGKEEGGGEEETTSEGGDAGGCGEAEEAAPEGEPLVIEDKVGNFKIAAAPGWSMERAPPDEGESQIRLILVRSGGAVTMEFYRYPVDNAEVFATEEPGDFLVKNLVENSEWLESYYGQGSAKSVRPDVDVRVKLGGAEKSCGFEARNITLEEEAKIEEAKKLIQRGDTSVTVPEFKPIVIRGRLAMISPHVYVVRAIFDRNVSDNETLVAEYNRILDSWEFATQEGKPPPLQAGDQALGNTLANAANGTERKKSKLHEYKQGVKVAAALDFDYVLPRGFQDAERVDDPVVPGTFYAVGRHTPIQVVAQDENNGWVWIVVFAKSVKELPPRTKFEEKKVTFDSWISNFEAQARGAGRMPKKPDKMMFGNLDGDGCMLKGTINNFRATETHLVTDEAGWRIEIWIKTRGSGATTFAKEIDTFRKKFRVQKK